MLNSDIKDFSGVKIPEKINTCLKKNHIIYVPELAEVTNLLLNQQTCSCWDYHIKNIV